MILPKMSWYVETYKVKDGDKDEKKQILFLYKWLKAIKKYKVIGLRLN